MTGSILRFLSRQPQGPLIYSDRHLLRLPQRSDYNQWRALRAESRAFLQPWEPTWRDEELSESSFRARVKRGNEEYRAGYAVPLLLFSRPDLTLLGGLTIGYIRQGAAQSCMIGYWMGERHSGQGHMLAALNIAIPYIYGQLQLHRIEAACIPENWKSVRLLEKAGFEREGLLRKYLKINGEWRDHVMYSRLPDDGEFGKMTRP
ncbi:N-acetyltransferase [Pseudorhizobium endolithicum]|uniref:N-acetyltransferase n=1 Tax=Pseudorhizobium endolithicum TaxID=1191678 RepID=A0ABM8PF48_9HYPH|nr:GNAT family protein [Pseudorhizobium endolithicum]CAD7026352.1 N-acetyltransferase [Pseudorhizobium endolithicum]